MTNDDSAHHMRIEQNAARFAQFEKTGTRTGGYKYFVPNGT
jgi:hypothetical protein